MRNKIKRWARQVLDWAVLLFCYGCVIALLVFVVFMFWVKIHGALFGEF